MNLAYEWNKLSKQYGKFTLSDIVIACRNEARVGGYDLSFNVDRVLGEDIQYLKKQGLKVELVHEGGKYYYCISWD